MKEGNFVQNTTLTVRIKERCKHKRITIKSLLEKCEMNRNTIYDIENKGSFPTAEKISRLADILDCSTDYLLGRIDYSEPLTDEDISLLKAYKSNPAAQAAIKNILKLHATPNTTYAEVAAFGGKENQAPAPQIKSETTLPQKR